MFEVADMWTNEADAAEYTAFLRCVCSLGQGEMHLLYVLIVKSQTNTICDPKHNRTHSIFDSSYRSDLTRKCRQPGNC